MGFQPVGQRVPPTKCDGRRAESPSYVFMSTPLTPLTPGATLGVFGSGQLGRMFVHAAQRLGYKLHVFSPHRHSPAGLAADVEHVGLFTDLASVERFARCERHHARV